MQKIITAVAFAGLFTLAACNNTAKDTAIQAQQHTIDSMNNELTKKRLVDSMNEVNGRAYSTVQAIPVMQPVIINNNGQPVRRTRTHSGSANNNAAQSGAPTYAQAPAAAPHKRGWSAKAKGAVIGTGTGAAVGALVNGRNRVAGAVIGGILGAGAGTGVGAIIDKKKGR